MKSILLIILIFMLLGITLGWFIYNLETHTFSASPYQQKQQYDSPLGNVLILFTSKEKNGGGKTYTLNHYKSLLENNQPAYLLTVKGAPLIEELTKEQLPFYTCNSMKFSLGKHMWQPGIEKAIYRICKEKNISIIHANHCREIVAAQKVAQKLPVKIIYTRHITSYLPDHILKGCDGIIGVSKQVTNYVIQRCKSSNLATQNITYLPPFLNEQAVKKFNPQRSKEQFFQEVGNVTIKPYPLLCKIANFYADVTHKNHPLLFRALAKLIHQDKIPVQVALAGDGANRRLYEQMVKDLNLEEYVYFLGNLSQEQTIELLFHSTVNVLASSHEAFGIVLLEAAMMKKPSIIATGTGAAEELVLHNKTGLLFENNNADSLALAIKYLMQNPDICQVLGHHAYEHIEQHFSNHATTLKMLAFYKRIAEK